METKDGINFERKLDEIENKKKALFKAFEDERNELLAKLKIWIEENSKEILSIEESLKEIDQKRNNHSKYTPKELQEFNRIYEDKKEFKKKVMRSKEEKKKQYNDLKNTEKG